MRKALKYMMFLFVIASISSCKKYKYEKEDVYGIYDVHKYYVDDFDSTFYFEQFNSAYIAFADNENSVYFSCFGVDTNNNFLVNTSGFWNFFDQNERINLNVAQGGSNNDYWIQYGPLALGENHPWDIINLDANEFVFHTNFENRIYKLILYRR